MALHASASTTRLAFLAPTLFRVVPSNQKRPPKRAASWTRGRRRVLVYLEGHQLDWNRAVALEGQLQVSASAGRSCFRVTLAGD